MLNRLPQFHQQRGVTLIEMMVGLLVALVVISAAGTMFLLSTRASLDLLRANRLNHTLQSSMDLITSELRRAGYWESTAAGAPANNPFDTITIGTECVLFSYDHLNASGNPIPDGQLQNTELSGFRRSGNAIQIRTSGTSATNCTASDNNWETLTDNNTVLISSLTFTLTARCLNPVAIASPAIPVGVTESTCATAYSTAPSGTQLLEQREIAISISGTVDSNGDGVVDATKTLTSRVEVRNNRLFIKP